MRNAKPTFWVFFYWSTFSHFHTWIAERGESCCLPFGCHFSHILAFCIQCIVEGLVFKFSLCVQHYGFSPFLMWNVKCIESCFLPHILGFVQLLQSSHIPSPYISASLHSILHSWISTSNDLELINVISLLVLWIVIVSRNTSYISVKI
jgi:hypothetical protein